MKVLTFDPGKTTGWSIWRDGELKKVGILLTFADLIDLFIKHNDATHCVYEGFARANASTGDQLETIELCGAIQALATFYHMQIEKQYPAQRKGYVEFAKMYVAPFSISSDVKRHCIDAVSHGLRFHDKCVEGWKGSWQKLS